MIIPFSSDSRFIYVSNIDGSDLTGAPVLNGELPKPFKTIKKASTFLREGFPDILLLKCEESFEETVALKSGRSNQERCILTSYGSGAKPVVIVTDKVPMQFGVDVLKFGATFKVICKNMLVDGIEFYQKHLDQASDTYNPYGGRNFISTVIKSPGGLENVTIQNCRFRHVQVNFQRYLEATPGYIANIVIDHNEFYDTYAGNKTSHIQGFLTDYFPITITRNIFDHNGWNETSPSGVGIPTIFNHNLYISNSTDTTIKDNIFCRPSSMSIKISTNAPGFVSKGVVIDNNLIIDGEIGISAGGNNAGDETHHDYVIANNVFMHLGTSVCTGRDLGHSMIAWGWKNGIISNNLMVGPGHLIPNQQFLSIPTNLRYTEVCNNMALNIKNGYPTQPNENYGIISFMNSNPSNIVHVHDNILHSTGGYTIVCKNNTGVTFSANTYELPVTPTNQPIFRINNIKQTVDQFSTIIGEVVTPTIPQLPLPTVAEFIASIRSNFDNPEYSAPQLNDNFRKVVNMKKASIEIEASQPTPNNPTNPTTL